MRIMKPWLMTVLVLTSPLTLAQWEGVTEWSGQTAMSTAVSGVVAQVPVQAGDTVKRGQLLLQLEQSSLRARLAQAEAEVAYQRAQRTEAGKELERAEELYERTLLADHDLDLARIADARAESSLQAAVAAEQTARQELAHSELRAPFDARIIARHVQPGQTVVTRFAAVEMLILAESGKMQAGFNLNAVDAAKLKNGQALQVEVAGQGYNATIASIQYQPAAELPYRLSASFPSEAPLMAGMPARVRLP